MVTVVFNPRDTSASKYSALSQYDYGQVLRIQGLNLPAAVEIDFALQPTGGTSVSRIGITKDGVTDVAIPDSMLENNDSKDDYSIYAFVFLTDATSGQTEYRITLGVKARPKPEVPGGTDNPDIFHEAVQAVREAAEQAAESENQAEGWAHGREDLPERAEDNARYYAGQAQEDSRKTAEDRKEVERLVESVSGIDEQVAKVEELSKNAQEAATRAETSAEQGEIHKQAAENASTAAQAAAGKTAEDRAAVQKAKEAVEELSTQVQENKDSVDKTAQQALADVNNAGQTQTDRVQTAGETAVRDIQTAQRTATGAVETAKTEAVKTVQTEGATQTGKVTAEGEKQVQAVQAAAQEIIADREQIHANKEGLAKLKEDLTKLDNDLYKQGRINLFDVTSVVKGKTLSNWAGKTMNDMYNSPNDSVINIIEVSEGDRLIQSIDGVSKGWLVNMCLYDSNGKFVSQNHGTEKLDELIVSKPIPSGIKYVRAISKMTDEQLNKFVIFKYSKGIDLSYLPFGEIEKIKQYASAEIVEKLSKEVETLDTKLNITHRPTVIFQFDDGDEDNRLDLMDKYGLNGCATMTFPVANPSVARNIAKRGYDVFAIYGGKNSDDGLIKSPPDSKDTTVAEWKAWINVLVEFAKQNGIDRPLTYMCMRSYMYENMLIACKELGINLFRYATLEMNDGTVKMYGWQKNQTIYNTDFFTTRGIQGVDTDISQLKADMEEVIKNKSVYIIFTHKVSDNPRMASETAYMDTHTNRFKAVLSYIKDLKNKGTVDVMSLHDYYNHYKLDGQKDDFYRVLGLMSK